MNIKFLIDQARIALKQKVDVEQLEAEILLSHVLNVSRTYLYSYPDHLLTLDEQVQFEQLLKRRLTGEPIAYILGKKPFWTFELQVSADTLIPRPETELLVELACQKLSPNDNLWIADLGTGSGAIAIALAMERPNWNIVATDQSVKALEVAKKNAARLGCNQITFCQGDWCQALPIKPYAAIVSNPPYIAFNDPEVEMSVYQFEPHNALFSEKGGLNDIQQIIMQAKNYLAPHGLLLLEHGALMADRIVALLEGNHYTDISSFLDLSGKLRVVMGRKAKYEILQTKWV